VSDGGPILDASMTMDAATHEDDGGAASNEALCDGSSQMRLTFQSTGGFHDATYSFTNPYGHVFFAIDGMCRFYVSSNWSRGIASGTLSKSDAEALSMDVHWRELAGWTWDFATEDGCPDSAGESLMRAHVFVGCICGCDAGAPKNLDEALSKAATWIMRLEAQGEPLDGAVSAIAFPSVAGASPVEQLPTWPLSRSMSSIEGLVHERHDSTLINGMLKSARFDELAEASKLRETRRAGGVFYASVQEASISYDLYVRDELPEAALKAWRGLGDTVPESRPVTRAVP
jgi:hypothetical protein